MADQADMRETCAMTAALREGFASRLRGTGFDLAQSADLSLRARAVFLRAQDGVGLPDCLRATIGVADDLDIAAGLQEHWAEGENT